MSLTSTCENSPLLVCKGTLAKSYVFQLFLTEMARRQDLGTVVALPILSLRVSV